LAAHHVIASLQGEILMRMKTYDVALLSSRDRLSHNATTHGEHDECDYHDSYRISLEHASTMAA
jgi:hypothetical protein